jgi:hypothetical protein
MLAADDLGRGSPGLTTESGTASTDPKRLVPRREDLACPDECGGPRAQTHRINHAGAKATPQSNASRSRSGQMSY